MMLRAIADFAADIDGELVLFTKNRTRVRAGSEPPGTRHLFEPVTTGPGTTGRSEIRALDSGGHLLEDRRE